MLGGRAESAEGAEGEAMINLTPEYLASLRKGVEYMRDHGLVLQDVRGVVTLALLDKIAEYEAAEDEAMRVQQEGGMSPRRASEAIAVLLKDMAKLEAKVERLRRPDAIESADGGWGGA